MSSGRDVARITTVEIHLVPEGTGQMEQADHQPYTHIKWSPA